MRGSTNPAQCVQQTCRLNPRYFHVPVLRRQSAPAAAYKEPVLRTGGFIVDTSLILQQLAHCASIQSAARHRMMVSQMNLVLATIKHEAVGL